MVVMTVSTEHIEIVQTHCGPRARIAGTGIKVADIVTDHYQLGWSPETIVRKFPHLTLAGVYAALAYYHDHKVEIDREIADGEQFVQEMMRQAPPSRLDENLARMGLTREQAMESLNRGDPLPPR